MIDKYITATILTILSGNCISESQTIKKPKLVINITIDQLRTDYLEEFYYLYKEHGFKELLKNGIVYQNPHYSFSPVDRVSSTASIITGTTPSDNGITGFKWFNKKSLMPINCVDDDSQKGILSQTYSSPKNLLTTTISDELKIATNGKAIVYSIAAERDVAVIGGGHAADGALWFDKKNKSWRSSTYYFNKVPFWIDSYNSLYTNDFTENNINANITNLALECIKSNEMGSDDITDMLYLTYDAKVPEDKEKNNLQLQNKYAQLDGELEKLISKAENKIGENNILFIITSTGYCDEKDIDYAKYKIPNGTFYINRTANLLNMYLSAIYGQDKYIESCFYNQIFLNLTKIEQKRISIDEVRGRAQSFLLQNEGVRNVFTCKDLLLYKDNANLKLARWYNPNNCGDLIIEISPSWKLLNEENQQQYTSRENTVVFPIIFYGAGIESKEITSPVQMDRIAPTIARSIRVRAPNACSSKPLF